MIGQLCPSCGAKMAPDFVNDRFHCQWCNTLVRMNTPVPIAEKYNSFTEAYNNRKVRVEPRTEFCRSCFTKMGYNSEKDQYTCPNCGDTLTVITNSPPRGKLYMDNIGKLVIAKTSCPNCKREYSDCRCEPDLEKWR